MEKVKFIYLEPQVLEVELPEEMVRNYENMEVDELDILMYLKLEGKIPNLKMRYYTDCGKILDFKTKNSSREFNYRIDELI